MCGQMLVGFLYSGRLDLRHPWQKRSVVATRSSLVRKQVEKWALTEVAASSRRAFSFRILFFEDGRRPLCSCHGTSHHTGSGLKFLGSGFLEFFPVGGLVVFLLENAAWCPGRGPSPSSTLSFLLPQVTSGGSAHQQKLQKFPWISTGVFEIVKDVDQSLAHDSESFQRLLRILNKVRKGNGVDMWPVGREVAVVVVELADYSKVRGSTNVEWPEVGKALQEHMARSQHPLSQAAAVVNQDVLGKTQEG